MRIRWGCSSARLAALSTFYPTAKNIDDKKERQLTFYRLIGKVPTLAAFAYRHSIGHAVRPSGQRAFAMPAIS